MERDAEMKFNCAYEKYSAMLYKISFLYTASRDDSAVMVLPAYPDPIDSIYITVEFENGESITKRIDVYFGDGDESQIEGASLQLKIVKEE